VRARNPNRKVPVHHPGYGSDVRSFAVPYRYLEDVAIADVAFEAWGKTLEELFSAATDASLGVMVDLPSALEPAERRTFTAQDDSLDILLFKTLSEIVYYKDAERLLLRCARCSLTEANGWSIAACLEGERIDESRHNLLLDVKAVTLHMLCVERIADGWKARVVLDI
jgi:SHS2 domain-containing protein